VEEVRPLGIVLRVPDWVLPLLRRELAVVRLVDCRNPCLAVRLRRDGDPTGAEPPRVGTAEVQCAMYSASYRVHAS
jgi:hypothetical protein